MRNNVTFDLFSGVLPKLGDFLREQEMDAEVVEEAEIQIKYKGYIERENSLPTNCIAWRISVSRPISISIR